MSVGPSESTPPYLSAPPLQYPEGYLEAQAAKLEQQQAEKEEEEEKMEEGGDGGAEDSPPASSKKSKGRKRKQSDVGNGATPPAKQPRYELTKHQKTLIKADSVNLKLWEELLDTKTLGAVSSIHQAK